jgi:hypothetical protein
VTEHGRPFTAAGFGDWFRDRCDEAEYPGARRTACEKQEQHSPQKMARRCMSSMAIFGWLTMKEAERYTQAARRKKLARNAAHLLVRATNETSPQTAAQLPSSGEAIESR